MAEKIVSPGVFTQEIDQSFLPAAIAEIGAANRSNIIFRISSNIWRHF